MAGIDHASGDTIVTIDADLQSDPEDIPILLNKLDEGADVVMAKRQAGCAAPTQFCESDR